MYMILLLTIMFGDMGSTQLICIKLFFGLNFSRFYLITLSSLAELPTVAAATGVALPAGQVHPRVVVRVDRLAEVDCVLQLLPV